MSLYTITNVFFYIEGKMLSQVAAYPRIEHPIQVLVHLCCGGPKGKIYGERKGGREGGGDESLGICHTSESTPRIRLQVSAPCQDLPHELAERE